MPVSTLKYHIMLTRLLHGSGSLLSVFIPMLENQLVEPEIMLVVQDKLKVSGLGYQLERREAGGMCGAADSETSNLLLICVTRPLQSWVSMLAPVVTGAG